MPNTEIKLIATDLDGTLLRDDHLTLSPANREALIPFPNSHFGSNFILCSSSEKYICCSPEKNVTIEI